MIKSVEIPKIYFQLAFHKYARRPVRLGMALVLLTGALGVGMTIAMYKGITTTERS